MSERYYFDIDDPVYVLSHAKDIAMLTDYVLTDADKQELQTFHLIIRGDASRNHLQTFAENSSLVRTLQSRYKEQLKQDEQRRRRERWWWENRKKVIVISTIVFVVLLVIGGVIVGSLYKKNYDDYVNYLLVQQADNGEMMYKVRIDVKEVEYNHVGRNITIEHTLNRKWVTDGDVVARERIFDFQTVITEKDGIDDVGYDDISFVTPYYVTADYSESKTITIKVKEEGGTKYRNAYAIYDVTYTITPYISKNDIKFWDVVFYK
jgi:hypothetical protein